jgi:nucleotide-binding universal stress UspA family protein
MTLRRVLFATDLSDLSFRAWPVALEMAQRFGAALHAVCVIEEPFALAPHEQYRALLRAMQEIRPQVERRLSGRTPSPLPAPPRHEPTAQPLAKCGG